MQAFRRTIVLIDHAKGMLLRGSGANLRCLHNNVVGFVHLLNPTYPHRYVNRDRNLQLKITT